MKVSPSGTTYSTIGISQEQRNLLEGELPKLAVKQVGQVEDVSFKGTRENHRLSFRYDKDLRRNVVHLVDNATGQSLKQTPGDTEVDHELRIKKLIGLHLDKQA